MSDGERDVVMLIQANDKSWVDEWLDSLRDKGTRAKIERQIDKLGRGLGVQKRLKEIAELKIDLGPGYRVYYAVWGQKTVVVLIGGGDKSSQSKDIESAQQLWQAFEAAGTPTSALRPWKEEPETLGEQEASEGEGGTE